MPHFSFPHLLFRGGVLIRPVTSLGHEWGEKLNYVQQIFPGGEKHPLVTGLVLTHLLELRE